MECKNLSDNNKNKGIRACFICGNNDEDMLFPIYGRTEWICTDCLDGSKDFDRCVICEKEKGKTSKSIVYSIGDLIVSENDDHSYCKEHEYYMSKPLSEDEESLAEHYLKD